MREIGEIKPFEEEFEILHMPPVRIIGRESRCGGALGNTAPALAEETLKPKYWDVLQSLPLVIKGGLGWTCEYEKESDTFIYIVCVMTPAGTPVPDGFVFRDIEGTLCAKGLFGESVPQTVKRANEAGFVTDWEKSGWNAELYIKEEEENPPRRDCEPNHWLVPVRKE